MLLLALAVPAFPASLWAHEAGGDKRLPVIGTAPPFALTSQDGKTVALADLCAGEPELAARLIVEGGFTERYDYALQTLTENPYGAWREYDAEDTIRFYALRLHELGMIKSSPQKIIANGTDWRFLNELKRELKT